MRICKNKNGFSYLLVCVITLFVAMLIAVGLSYADVIRSCFRRCFPRRTPSMAEVCRFRCIF